MRIHELEIRDLRGIRHLLLEPAGQNLVIWGPNGSGKSAVVDRSSFCCRAASRVWRELGLLESAWQPMAPTSIALVESRNVV